MQDIYALNIRNITELRNYLLDQAGHFYILASNYDWYLDFTTIRDRINTINIRMVENEKVPKIVKGYNMLSIENISKSCFKDFRRITFSTIPYLASPSFLVKNNKDYYRKFVSTATTAADIDMSLQDMIIKGFYLTDDIVSNFLLYSITGNTLGLEDYYVDSYWLLKNTVRLQEVLPIDTAYVNLTKIIFGISRNFTMNDLIFLYYRPNYNLFANLSPKNSSLLYSLGKIKTLYQSKTLNDPGTISGNENNLKIDFEILKEYETILTLINKYDKSLECD